MRQKPATLRLFETSPLALLTLAILTFGPLLRADEPTLSTGYSDYRQLIDLLRGSDSVVPPQSTVHPVSAMFNREAIVPPQCYTKTQGQYNPCYVCHQESINGRENVMNDGDIQIDYSFSDLGQVNRWENLQQDRTDRIDAISDERIIAYINENNYSELAPRLHAANFKGWIPDLKDLDLGPDAFDNEGFAKDGSFWVAFNYKPFPSSFWPTNGATDDVMIRLPIPFRSDQSANPSPEIYKANLAILEANMKGLLEISSLPIDEKKIGIDLDRDGAFSEITYIRKVDSFVGGASDIPIETHIFPEGTEFLHTVRYLGIGDNQDIVVSRRMKEVRYMKKWKTYSKAIYARNYQLEGFEKESGFLPGYMNLGDWGLDNGFGWSIQGFIEDRQGRLRANTFEENFFCMGCHSSIGSTIDKTFSFVRKVEGANGWGYINLNEIPDAPTLGESKGEYQTYLERVGGGSEFRNNPEMQQRWFRSDGSLDHEKVSAANSIYELIVPSIERALSLNKAYKTIVEDQDYIFGRDPTVTPPENVYDRVDNVQTPTLPVEKTYKWNILLDWRTASDSSDS